MSQVAHKERPLYVFLTSSGRPIQLLCSIPFPLSVKDYYLLYSDKIHFTSFLHFQLILYYPINFLISFTVF